MQSVVLKRSRALETTERVGGADVKQTYLRMDEDLHKQLRHEAAEDDTSLNKCIVTLLREALAARRVVSPTPQRTESRPQS